MQHTLDILLDGGSLSESQASSVMRSMADGTLEPAVSGAVLAAMRTRGETVEELRGFANAMRDMALTPSLPTDRPLLDTCGTGGDGSGSLNLSTGVALLAAACGARVVKHGNRSVSSRSGSADVLEALGYSIPTTPGDVARDLEETGFTFLFAPSHHPAMKAIMPVRRALGVRTVFNVLGPLTNPARPEYQLVGAFDLKAAELMAAALHGLGVRRAFIVHGAAGWDEPTPIGPFHLFDVNENGVRSELRDPADLGLPRCTPTDLRGGTPAENARQLREVLHGERLGPHRDALLLGTALALEVTGIVSRSTEGMDMAREAIDCGRAGALLRQLTACSTAA